MQPTQGLGNQLRLGVIGTGVMGSAIARAILDSHILGTDRIWFYEIIDAAARWFVDHGHHRCSSLVEVLSSADIILLAVKPQNFSELISIFSSFSWRPQHILISILAGTSIDSLQRGASPSLRIVRAMPNLGATIGESITAIDGRDPKALDIAERLLQTCGPVIRLSEKHFNLVTAVSGSGPAYFFLLMEILAKKAEAGGIPKDAAMRMAIQTAVAAGKLAKSTEKERTPEEWRKMVTSKGGTTDAAITVLTSKKWGEIVAEALDAAQERGRQLNAKF